MNPKFQDLAFDAVIPSAVLFNKNIEPSAIKLYAFIRGLSRLEGYCYASNKYLAECMDCDESTVKRLINSLSAEKFIDVETNKEGIHWQRRIYLGVNLKESLRRLENAPPPAQNRAPPSSKSSHNKRYIKEDIEIKDCLSRLPDGTEDFPKSIKKFDTSGREIFFELDQIFRKAVFENKDWKTSEIKEAWNVLVKYAGRINDAMAFIEGTIKNLRKKSFFEKKSIHKEECQKKTTNVHLMGKEPVPLTEEKKRSWDEALKNGPLVKAYQEILQKRDAMKEPALQN